MSTKKVANMSVKEIANMSDNEVANMSTEEACSVSAEKAGQLSAEIEGNVSAEKEGNISAKNESHVSAEKEGDKSPEKEHYKSAEKVGNKSAEKKGNLSAEKEGNVSAEKEGDKSAEKEHYMSAQKVGNKSAEKKGNLSAEKEGNVSAEKEGDKSAEKKGNLSTEKEGNVSAEKESNVSAEIVEEPQLTLFDCLTKQMSEMELLQAMYPKKDELILSDSNILEEISQFLENKTEYLGNHIDFIMNIEIDDYKILIAVNLPSFYPVEEPDVYLKCDKFNRPQETHLNSEVTKSMKKIHNDEVCVYSIISWLQDLKLEEIESLDIQDLHDTINKMQVHNCFLRIWVFSNCIYNKKKREEIEKFTKEFRLTGFCLPGKPGLICVEGWDCDCKIWWSLIKSLIWKKIVIKKIEIFKISERNEHQKFIQFEALIFPNASKKSEFAKFIGKHGLTHVFNEVCGSGHA